MADEACGADASTPLCPRRRVGGAPCADAHFFVDHYLGTDKQYIIADIIYQVILYYLTTDLCYPPSLVHCFDANVHYPCAINYHHVVNYCFDVGHYIIALSFFLCESSFHDQHCGACLLIFVGGCVSYGQRSLQLYCLFIVGAGVCSRRCHVVEGAP